MSKEDNMLHKHHRQRLKNRFLNEGLDNFEPHNIVELLLFFGVPQGDTNELAHELLNKFGSIPGIFSASYSELIKINGIGNHTATLLKFIPELFKIYWRDKMSREIPKSFSVDDAATYLIPLYVGVENEVVRALYFDNKMSLIENVVIFEGDVNSANLSYKSIAQIAITRNIPNVILAHNHPGGIPIPSMEDNKTTETLKKGLELFNINLIEHIVIADNKYTKILNTISKLKSF